MDQLENALGVPQVEDDKWPKPGQSVAYLPSEAKQQPPFTALLTHTRYTLKIHGFTCKSDSKSHAEDATAKPIDKVVVQIMDAQGGEIPEEADLVCATFDALDDQFIVAAWRGRAKEVFADPNNWHVCAGEPDCVYVVVYVIIPNSQ